MRRGHDEKEIYVVSGSSVFRARCRPALQHAGGGGETESRAGGFGGIRCAFRSRA